MVTGSRSYHLGPVIASGLVRREQISNREALAPFSIGGRNEPDDDDGDDDDDAWEETETPE